MTVLDKSHITKQTPEKNLLEPKKRSGGRNNQAKFRSGIAVAATEAVPQDRFPARQSRRSAKVESIEYDPNRSANIALLHYADGDKRYILHPWMEVGATVTTGDRRTFFLAMP